jgi:Uma2 family endonuclease
VQPPPDLAIEVEVSHSADMALIAWGRLGVPEVWRFQPRSAQFAICVLQGDGSYAQAERSALFPALSSADILAQLARANELGADRWNEQLEAWVRDVVLPKSTGGL